MLKELCEIIGVSGDEEKVREFIKENICKDVDEISEDAYGNLIVRKGRIKKGRRILLTAHMDEVGLMVTGIDKNGLLRFKTIGVPPETWSAKRVLIGKNRIPGVVGHKPVHLADKEELKRRVQDESLFIDVGAASQEEANRLVEIGDTGTFDTPFYENHHLIFGKALDNRIGCYILIHLIKNTDLGCHYAFTVQEEVGLRGAMIVAYRVSPDMAIAIDTTSSGEFPSEKDLPQYPVLDGGPVITIADMSLICDRRIVTLIERTAKENGIPLQHKQPMIGGTDAGSIHLTKEGIPSGVISVPARYIHSPLSIASRKDIELTVKLVLSSVERILKGVETKWN